MSDMILKLIPISDTKKNSHLFFASVVLFLIGILSGSFVDMKIAQAIQSCALGLFIYSSIKLIDFNLRNAYFGAVFATLIAWYVFVIVRDVDLSYDSIKRYLFSEFTFWSFVVPFAAFLPKTLVFFRVMFRWFYGLGIFFLFFTLATFKFYGENSGIAEQGIWAFSTGCGFILLTWKYHSNQRRILSIIVLLLAFVIATVLARRNVMLTCVNFLIASYALYFFYYTRGDALKRIASGLVILVVFVGALLYFLQRMDQDFKLITSRATEDTREYVFNYYFDDIKNVKWIGRGIDGTYFCPLFIPDTDSEPIEDRDLIECGYLQMVLKGGYVSVILFMMIALPAIYLGIFRSNNGLSKACGIVILLWLIDMLPYGLASFSVRYILVWVAIGVCYSEPIRMLSETKIMKSLTKKG